MVLKSQHGKVQVSVETDANGYYFIPHIRKGRPGLYELWMMTPAGAYQNRNVLLKTNGFCAEDFVIEGE